VGWKDEQTDGGLLRDRSKELVRVGKGAVVYNFKEDETGGRDKERYDDERVDPGGWVVRS